MSTIKVLVVDDDPSIRILLSHILKVDDFQVILASDGHQGLQKFNEESPELVLTDLLMPVKSGIQLIKNIRLDLKSQTPIIVLSSVGQTQTVMHAFELGANDFITKPFDTKEILVRINNVLRSKWNSI